jgi:heme exporter protein D
MTADQIIVLTASAVAALALVLLWLDTVRRHRRTLRDLDRARELNQEYMTALGRHLFQREHRD